MRECGECGYAMLVVKHDSLSDWTFCGYCHTITDTDGATTALATLGDITQARFQYEQGHNALAVTFDDNTRHMNAKINELQYQLDLCIVALEKMGITVLS